MASPVDLSSIATLEEQIFVGAMNLQQAELAVPEENRPDNINVEFSAEDGSVTITLTLETETSISNSQAIIEAKPYL